MTRARKVNIAKILFLILAFPAGVFIIWWGFPLLIIQLGFYLETETKQSFWWWSGILAGAIGWLLWVFFMYGLVMGV